MATSTEASAPRFRPRSQPPRDGLAVIYDLTDFTRFFTQPDAHRYVPRFLNRIADVITISIEGGESYWDTPARTGPISGLKLRQRKFLGDGELLIFDIDENDPKGISRLMNRLWNVQAFFHKILAVAQEELPVAGLPPKIKFGIARGDLYELQEIGEPPTSEYIGVSINLASRLVKYCPELSFIASARVELSTRQQHDDGYTRVVASKIRGFPDEIVIVDKTEFNELSEQTRENLFRLMLARP